MSAFSFTELHVLDQRAFDLPLLKSNVCKQGQSRKVKTPQPRGEKESIVRVSDLGGKTSLTALPPASPVQPADSFTVSPKCLDRIWRTFLSVK